MKSLLKKGLAQVAGSGQPRGMTLLVYHRIGGGTGNELDVRTETFRDQVNYLVNQPVVSIDEGLDRLDAGDNRPSFVLTFDDGFRDLYENGWPLLRERQIPFTVYLATKYMGKEMQWAGATATGAPGQGLTWGQIDEMVESGLCTIGNHTHSHARPETLSIDELDECSRLIESKVGFAPQHFAYPWGVGVKRMESELEKRFRSSVTLEVGRNLDQTNRMRLQRVSVRGSDPIQFFSAKFVGNLVPERTYERIVQIGKTLGLKP